MVSRVAAADTALSKATRTTLVGSTTPASTKSSNVSVAALYPKASLPFATSEATTAPSFPEFCAIWRIGSCKARFNILIPSFSSESCTALSSKVAAALNNATPPPGTMPSSTAAFVADKASSVLCWRAFCSTSVAAPTFITATPPESFASLS